MTHLSFGVHVSGRVLDAVEAARGLACQCTCPVCGGALVARQGEVKAPHFAHHDSAKCVGAAMTALHLAAQQLIVDAQRLALPALPVQVSRQHARLGTYYRAEQFEHGAEWDLCDARAEFVIGRGRRADVVGDDPEMGRVSVEIRVTHEVDAEKARDLVELGIPCVEVNLQEWVGQILTMETLAEQVLDRRDNRTWVHHPRMAAYERQLMEGYPAWVAQREAEEAERARERAVWEKQLRLRQAAEEKAKDAQRALFSQQWGDAYKKAVEVLGLEGRRLPYYIDKSDINGRPFCVDGKVWRAVLFAAWIHGRCKSTEPKMPIPSDADMARKIAMRIGAVGCPEIFDIRSASRAVRGYLRYLTKCGIIEERDGRHFVCAERPLARRGLNEASRVQATAWVWASVWPHPAQLLDRLERFAEDHKLDKFDAPLMVEELLVLKNRAAELSAEDLRDLTQHCGAPRSMALTLFRAVGLGL